MEASAGRKMQTTYATITRVYSPTHGSAAYAYAQTAEVLSPAERPQVQARPKTQPRSRQQAAMRVKPRVSAGTRWAAVASMLALSGALLLVVFRYYNISRQYAVINTLNEDINNTELRIRELNVGLECAVNIQTAQEAASRLGMTYPTSKQYVRAGDALMIDGAQPETQSAPELPPADPAKGVGPPQTP